MLQTYKAAADHADRQATKDDTPKRVYRYLRHWFVVDPLEESVSPIALHVSTHLPKGP